MSRPRLTADFWVTAYLSRLQADGIAAYVQARGDAKAGAVMVKVATMDGRAQLWQRQFDPITESRVWIRTETGAEAAIDARLLRERARDADMWIIEIEDRQGRHLLDMPGLDG